MPPPVTAAIGLMSGTSLDGIDVAYLETDGLTEIKRGPAATTPYTPEFRARLRQILGSDSPTDTVREIERELTLLHAEAVARFLAEHPACRPELIGFHGHTIMHNPREGRTWQIGDGALLASRLGLPVVSDFRSADVARGGEGAPLVPVYHQGLARDLPRPIAILNLGGVANLTWLGEDAETMLAFDTGPGNALIDDWVFRHTGRPCDEDGLIAARGEADMAIVARFLSHRYFAKTPPKSLDRDAFQHLLPESLGISDGAATLVAVTVAAVRQGLTQVPAPPCRVLVTGGGRHNPTLMAALRQVLAVAVAPVEAVGWDGDALEAQAFAYLAVRSEAGLPLSFPGTTGVPAPLTGGRIDFPLKRVLS